MSKRRPENPAKVSLRNINRFLKGYLSMFSESFGLLPKYKQEQVIWRTERAKPCMDNKACLYCGCHTPAKFYEDSECEDPVRKCYPEMMDESTWEQYKKDNSIEVKIQ